MLRSSALLVTAGAAQPTAMSEPLPQYSQALRPIDAYPLQLGRSPSPVSLLFRPRLSGAARPIDFTRDLDWAGLSHGGLPIRGGSTIRSLSHRRPGRYRYSSYIGVAGGNG
jgi:hypothetical protein